MVSKKTRLKISRGLKKYWRSVKQIRGRYKLNTSGAREAWKISKDENIPVSHALESLDFEVKVLKGKFSNSIQFIKHVSLIYDKLELEIFVDKYYKQVKKRPKLKKFKATEYRILIQFLVSTEQSPKKNKEVVHVDWNMGTVVMDIKANYKNFIGEIYNKLDELDNKESVLKLEINHINYKFLKRKK